MSHPANQAVIEAKIDRAKEKLTTQELFKFLGYDDTEIIKHSRPEK
jgi:hypothetical protein